MFQTFCFGVAYHDFGVGFCGELLPKQKKLKPGYTNEKETQETVHGSGICEMKLAKNCQTLFKATTSCRF